VASASFASWINRGCLTGPGVAAGRRSLGREAHPLDYQCVAARDESGRGFDLSATHESNGLRDGQTGPSFLDEFEFAETHLSPVLGEKVLLDTRCLGSEYRVR
jgi:hypothetical protein